MMMDQPQLPMSPCTQLSADEQRLREHGQHAEVDGALEIRAGRGQLRLQFGADEQFFVELRLGARGHLDGRPRGAQSGSSLSLTCSWYW